MPLPTLRVYLDDGTGTYPYDISSYVRIKDSSLSITRGRPDEFGTIQPGMLNLTLRNPDGRFTLGHSVATSTYGLAIDQGIRVTETDKNGVTRTRFTGFVEAWPTEFDNPTGGYAVVALQAIDGISRLSRLTLKSMADEQVELRGPLLSFPLSNMYSYSADPSWTGNPTSPLATKGTGTPPTFSASPFAAAAGMEGAAGASFAGGAGLKATDYVPTTSSNLSIELLVNCSTAPTVNGAYALTALYAAGGASVLVFIDNSGAIAVCRPNIDYVDTAVAPPRSALGTINVCDGKPHHVVVTYAGTALKVYVDGNLDASASTSTFSVGSGCELRMGRFQQAVQTSGSTYEFVDTLIGSLAYVSVYGYAIAAAQVLDNYHAFILGGAGDTTDQRFTRIANYAAWPSSVNATSSDIVCAVSPLNGVTAYDALQAVVSTEGGAWYADGAGVLQFQDRSVRTSAAMSAPEVTATNQITPGVTFPGDKQYLKNVISVTTASGNQYTVSDTASVTRSGVYSDDLGTLLYSSDTVALNAASFRLAQYANVDPKRCNTITLNLLDKAGDLAAAALLVEPGDHIRVTNLPATSPATTVDLIVEGLRETLSTTGWTIEYNTVPAARYEVFKLGDSVYGALGVYPLFY